MFIMESYTYCRLNIRTSFSELFSEFFQKTTFWHGGNLCFNAYILSKRRIHTPIIIGVDGRLCGVETSKIPYSVVKTRIPFSADFYKNPSSKFPMWQKCVVLPCPTGALWSRSKLFEYIIWNICIGVPGWKCYYEPWIWLPNTSLCSRHRCGLGSTPHATVFKTRCTSYLRLSDKVLNRLNGSDISLNVKSAVRSCLHFEFYLVIGDASSWYKRNLVHTVLVLIKLT